MLNKPTKLKVPNKILLSLFFLFCLSGQSLFAVHDYINALYLTTYFYGAQRCGNTASWIHGPCHLKDGLAPGGTGIDLTGGWHDCGDHVTFGQTASYSAGMLLEGYLLKPASYKDNYSQAYSAGSPNGIPDILDEAKIMTDLLIKCITGGRFYYQKGNGDYDHKHMAEPAYFSTNYTITEGGESDGGRPLSYVTSGGSNVCGDAAAALALMAIAYQPYDAAYAATCFTKAKEVFAIGDTSPGTVSGGSYYGAANYQDDMAWGGATIYRASVARGAPENTYLTKAVAYNDGGQGAGSWPLCYDHTEFLAHYNIYKINGTASDLTWMINDVAYYKSRVVSCGTGSYAWATGWGSLRYAGNMAFGAALLNSITAVAADYTFVKNNVDFILGTHGDVAGSPNAPAGRSFVIGYTNPDNVAAGSVAHPHHRAAFGKTTNADTLWPQENTSPGSVPYLYQLKGALVGGPQASCSNYNDRIDDYVANEVGIDYNAGLVGAIAYVISVQNPSTPTYTPTTNLSWTRTRTPTITPTYTITPVPPPTNKLNLQVMSQGSSENCTSQTFGFEYRITNWETTVVSTSNVAIKIWLDTTDTVSGSIYNARKYDSGGTDLGTVTASIAQGATAGCAGATKSILITVTTTDIPANGGYIMIQGALERGGYQTPFDAGCNDYTKMLAAWTTYQNNPTQTLWQGTNLVCEYTSASTQDPLTGLHPCTGGNGCGAAGTATRTPSRTPTVAVPTLTYTRTVTNTPVNTATYTRTSTPTFTRTPTVAVPTPTFTFTRTTTGTWTRTLTNTPVNTATFTFTRTVTDTPVNTLTFTRTITHTSTRTATPTFTFTLVSTAVNTFTFTRTATPSFSVTVSPVNTNTRTQTFTSTPTVAVPTATFTFTRTSTPLNTATYTRTATPSASVSATASVSPTNTFTITETRTVSASPSNTNTRTPAFTSTPTVAAPTVTFTFTRTNTAVNTVTFTRTITPTYTRTATGTYTVTGTPTFTRTATGTNTRTATGTYTATYTRTLTFTPTFTATPSITSTWTWGYGTHTNTPTITVSPTRTGTFTVTPTSTATATATNTGTSTFTSTSSATGTNTPMPTVTFTRTWTLTSTASNTPLPTASVTQTYTPQSSPSNTSTRTATGTATFTRTATGTATDTATPSFTRTMTFTSTPTATRTFTATGTFTRTASPTGTRTATATVSETHTVSPTVTETWTGTPPTPSVTPTVTRTHTNSPTFTITVTDTATVTETVTETNTGTDTVTVTETEVPTDTMTAVPTETSTQASTVTATPQATVTVFVATNTPVNTATRTPTYAIPSSTNTQVIPPTNTVTRTNTPQNTATMTNTLSATMTVTRTRTVTPVNTATPTFTRTAAATATPTFTATAQPDKQAIGGMVPFPNPVHLSMHTTLYINFTAARTDSDSLSMKIYTSAYRLVKRITFSGAIAGAMLTAGRFTCSTSEFSRLASGAYYYVLVAEKTGVETRSKVDKIIILK